MKCKDCKKTIQVGSEPYWWRGGNLYQCDECRYREAWASLEKKEVKK